VRSAARCVKASEDLASQMAEKTNDQLLAMFEQPEDWIPEALDLARAELQRRGVDAPVFRPASHVPQCRGAFAFQGVGTIFYGERDFRQDGTYTTTQWFIFGFIPILPLRSFRVRYQGQHGFTRNYLVYEKSFPNWKQVIYVYAYMASYFMLFRCILHYGNGIDQFIQRWFSPSTGNYIFAGVVLFGLAAPVAVPFILRWLARKKEPA